jgi:hypothetical protein
MTWSWSTVGKSGVTKSNLPSSGMPGKFLKPKLKFDLMMVSAWIERSFVMKILIGLKWIRLGVVVACLEAVLSTAQAQEATSTSTASENAPISADNDIHFKTGTTLRPDDLTPHASLQTDYTYVGGSTTRTASRGLGELSEQESHLGADFLLPLNDSFALIFKTSYKRFDFGNLAVGSGIPQNLQSVDAGMGVRYKVDDQWQVTGLFSPQLQEVNGWGSSDYIHYGGAIGANYKWNQDLTLGFGLGINPGGLDKIPVLPAVSVRWHFADQWTLNLGVPRSSLDYALTKELHLWMGPSFEGGEFKTSSGYGTAIGNPGLNSQKLEYQEIRLGAGADYDLNPLVTLTGEVGGALYRDFYFEDANYRPHSDPAPFAQVGVRLKF